VKTGYAVMGLWYGDEGKGRVVDYLASQEQCVVVRSNGGAQAGHTVEVDGIRHVFHHFGSGTLAKRPTHLSRFFICNPMVYKREREELMGKGFAPLISCDPNAMVTTPWDMAINQLIEKKRGVYCHGSVGLGIYETVLRHETFPLTVSDLLSQDLGNLLLDIRGTYVIDRLRELDIDASSHPAFTGNVLFNYIEDCRYFLGSLSDNFTEKEDHIIFEAAQGLMLDEEYNFDPIHSTPSNCGMKNISILSDEYGVGSVDCIYVSRSYATRHGAGPLHGQCELGLKGMDKTNVDHEYQGKLKYARLDVMRERGTSDFNKYSRDHDNKDFVVTCIDQHDDGLWRKLEPRTVFNGSDRNSILYNGLNGCLPL